MAYANFKPTIWSKYLQTELDKKAILADFCNRKFEGEAKKGEQVKILGIGSPTISDYTGGSLGTPETVADTSVYLLINKADSFYFGVEDIDAAQSQPNIMEELLKGAVKKMKLKADTFIASLAVDAGSLSTSLKISTAAEAKAAIDKGLLNLRENDVDIDTEVVIEIPPFVYQLFKDKYIELDTANSEMLKKGIVGYYDSARVRVSNNLHNDGTDFYAMIRTKDAIAYADAMNKVEAERPSGYMEDAMKGLHVYGGKVVRPKELYTIKCHK